jgi:hypothetical protein
VRHCLIAVLMMFSAPFAFTDTSEDEFVTSKILLIFYHEIGHAIIDMLQLPIFCQEPDAADVLSILLVDGIFEEASAQSIACDAAFGFMAKAARADETYFWDVRGPDEQRYYNVECIFYGGNVAERAKLGLDLGCQKIAQSVGKKNLSWRKIAGGPFWMKCPNLWQDASYHKC